MENPLKVKNLRLLEMLEISVARPCDLMLMNFYNARRTAVRPDAVKIESFSSHDRVDFWHGHVT